jgi:hypothetical protein
MGRKKKTNNNICRQYKILHNSAATNLQFMYIMYKVY